MTGPPSSATEPVRAHDDRYDAIVIGSGMGGLACASFLAQLRGMRVLVLERHWRLGGFTHVFSRPHVGRWEVGLHYVGQMDEGEPIRALMDFATGGRVGWRMMPSPFERYHFPGAIVDQPVRAEHWIEWLTAQWPSEAGEIARFFEAIQAAYEWFGTRLSGGRVAARPTSRGRIGRVASPASAGATTRDALDAAGLRSPELRAVLTAQWGNYGLPPSRSSFVSHAVVARHFLGGGWFPEEGASSIAAAARAIIEEAGGLCLTSREVEYVLIERERAVGVRVAHGPAGRRERRDYLAPTVISDAGVATTFSLLSPESPVRRAVAAELARLPQGSSAVQLFIGLSSPESLGIHGENHWIFDDWDHDAVYDRRNELAKGRASMAYLSFPSLKVRAPNGHVAEIIAPLDHDELARWRHEPWRRRGQAYEDVKRTITDALLALAERRVPGFGELVSYTELGTPLTIAGFTGHAGGAIYGLPSTPERFSLSCTSVETPVIGLLLTGSDVAVPGVVGALMGGAATAGHVLGAGGLQRLLAAARGRTPRRAATVAHTGAMVHG